MRAAGWRNFNNRIAANTKMTGGVELNWTAETDMGVRMWDLNGVSEIISTDTAQGRRFPVTGIG